jgi:hypothetical protein
MIIVIIALILFALIFVGAHISGLYNDEKPVHWIFILALFAWLIFNPLFITEVHNPDDRIYSMVEYGAFGVINVNIPDGTYYHFITYVVPVKTNFIMYSLPFNDKFQVVFKDHVIGYNTNDAATEYNIERTKKSIDHLINDHNYYDKLIRASYQKIVKDLASQYTSTEYFQLVENDENLGYEIHNQIMDEMLQYGVTDTSSTTFKWAQPFVHMSDLRTNKLYDDYVSDPNTITSKRPTPTTYNEAKLSHSEINEAKIKIQNRKYNNVIVNKNE